MAMEHDDPQQMNLQQHENVWSYAPLDSANHAFLSERPIVQEAWRWGVINNVVGAPEIGHESESELALDHVAE